MVDMLMSDMDVMYWLPILIRFQRLRGKEKLPWEILQASSSPGMNLGLVFGLFVSETRNLEYWGISSGTVGFFPNKLRGLDRKLPMLLGNPCGVKGW